MFQQAAQEFKLSRLVSRIYSWCLVAKLTSRVDQTGGRQSTWLPGFGDVVIPVHKTVHVRRDAAWKFQYSVIVFGSVSHDNLRWLFGRFGWRKNFNSGTD